MRDGVLQNIVNQHELMPRDFEFYNRVVIKKKSPDLHEAAFEFENRKFDPKEYLKGLGLGRTME